MFSHKGRFVALVVLAVILVTNASALSAQEVEREVAGIDKLNCDDYGCYVVVMITTPAFRQMAREQWDNYRSQLPDNAEGVWVNCDPEEVNREDCVFLVCKYVRFR